MKTNRQLLTSNPSDSANHACAQGDTMDGAYPVRTWLGKARLGILLACASVLVMTGCGGGTNGLNGLNGLSSTISATTVPVGNANCPTGGKLLTSGVDTNGNGVIDASEVTSSQYICNGAAGANGSAALLASSDIPAGDANCPAGGTRVTSGTDTNGNGVLDTSEVTNTRYVCNGVTGAKGSTGDAGATGAAAFNTLTVMTAEPAGTHCATGGTKVTLGLDANRNNVLDSAEVSGTSFVCNGPTGMAALMTSVALPVGDANCANGGSKIVSGSNQDGTGQLLKADGSLNANNVSQIGYACNGATGATGASGKNTLQNLAVLPVGDTNCSNGGVRITAWLDLDGNGALNGNEVPNTSYVCNGANGSNGQNGASTRIATKPVVAADGQCVANGGVAITAWLDLDNSGTVNGSEVPSTTYVCNGVNGTNGTNGTNGLNGANGLVIATPEAAGGNCTYGGTKIVSGTDLDGDLALKDTATVHEIIGTAYACTGATGATGASGHNTLISTDNVPAGDATCATGGRKVTTWLDSNDNGVLDLGETTHVAMVCNGVAGANAAMMSSTFPAGTGKCIDPNVIESPGRSGTTVTTWIDANGNNQLDSGEPSNTFDVCNGTNGMNGATGAVGSKGANGLVIGTNEPAGGNCTYGGTKLVSGTDLDGDSRLIGSAEIASTSYACNGAPGATGPGIKAYFGAGGPQTYTVPAGVKTLVVEAWGGGGGGGNSWNCLSSVNFCEQTVRSAATNGPGGGGGSGGYQKVLLQVTPGNTLTVSPGAGGVANSIGNGNGIYTWYQESRPGGNSTVTHLGITVVTATGGGAGISSLWNSTTGDSVNSSPGAGGSGSYLAPAKGWTQSIGTAGSGTLGGYSVLGAGGNGQNLNARTQGPQNGGDGVVVITPWQY